jgi:histidinol dehydrogenase
MQVSPIVEQVRQQGDAAVREYTRKFDKVELDKVCIKIEVCDAHVVGAVVVDV